MTSTAAVRRRVEWLQGVLAESESASNAVLRVEHTSTGTGSDERKVRIGTVTVSIIPPLVPAIVPLLQPSPLFGDAQEVLRHLQWIMQKDLLGQDVFLLGPPGPLRRWLVMRFCQLTQREVEYIALSRDTTESDLKQRREIRNGTAYYEDQGAVLAATNVLNHLQ